MAYAVGAIPKQYERITSLNMTWTVNENPTRGRAFFSPWFGMDPGDNLNLIQPVNPWSGSSWSMYTEYYQWSPTHNSNSKQYPVQAGQTLQGSLQYDEASDSYVAVLLLRPATATAPRRYSYADYTLVLLPRTNSRPTPGTF